LTTTIQHINAKSEANKKQLAILVDPDKHNDERSIGQTIAVANEAKVDHIFVGGSLITNGAFGSCIEAIKKATDIPVVIFPGSPHQVHNKADAVLFLSLISGRNSETLIGHHVIAAPKVKASGIEVIPTGYMLIDSGQPTAASYMSNSTPIPYDKDDIAMCTAMAGEMLGLRLIYMDGGSGAEKTISPEMISKVKSNISIPLIIGGGIKTPKVAHKIWQAGADVVVVGNATEKDPLLIRDIAQAANT
jgi:phosphoglycerol geranylgeranyltransferase